HSGNRLGLGPWALVPKLIEACGPDQSYQILSQGEYPGQNSWLFAYFMALPAEMANISHLSKLYALYESTPAGELLRGFDYFLKFELFDPSLFVRITRTLVNRSLTAPELGQPLAELFSRHSALSRRLKELFAGE